MSELIKLKKTYLLMRQHFHNICLLAQDYTKMNNQSCLPKYKTKSVIFMKESQLFFFIPENISRKLTFNCFRIGHMHIWYYIPTINEGKIIPRKFWLQYLTHNKIYSPWMPDVWKGLITTCHMNFSTRTRGMSD